MIQTSDSKVYLVGGGIASLATAAYFIRDGKFQGKNITLFEELNVAGGAMDGSGNAEQGYVIRGGRMFNFSYQCTYDLLSFIPSLENPGKTVLDDLTDFNEKVKTHANCRLVDKNHRKIDVSKMGFSNRDRMSLIDVLTRSEDHLGKRRIDDCFEPEFFKTNFWYMWATMFAFQPWHSAVEFRRYLHRFIHEFSRINTLAGVDRSPYNQYDSIIRPIEKWLKDKGVNFEFNTQVTDLHFKDQDKRQTVERIDVQKNGDSRSIAISPYDAVIVTNGSMTEGTALGTMRTPVVLKNKNAGGAWKLWERIARASTALGRPRVFDSRIDESKWMSFTVTQQNSLFFDLMEKFSNNTAGSGGLITFRDSNWLMSIVLAYQPHFVNQPEQVKVFWGYGLFVDEPGNYVKKPMSECNGEEILQELCGHLGFDAQMEDIIEHSNCIPCMMPFITSQFLTREKGDRPEVIPEGFTNLAMIGQFCELPEDTVFTVEYSVRAAMTAVYDLLGLEKEPPPIYKGEHHFQVLVNALKTMFSSGEKPSDLREMRP